jgi:hypothetical protein
MDTHKNKRKLSAAELATEASAVKHYTVYTTDPGVSTFQSYSLVCSCCTERGSGL